MVFFLSFPVGSVKLSVCVSLCASASACVCACARNCLAPATHTTLPDLMCWMDRAFAAPLSAFPVGLLHSPRPTFANQKQRRQRQRETAQQIGGCDTATLFNSSSAISFWSLARHRNPSLSRVLRPPSSTPSTPSIPPSIPSKLVSVVPSPLLLATHRQRLWYPSSSFLLLSFRLDFSFSHAVSNLGLDNFPPSILRVVTISLHTTSDAPD